MEKDSTIVLLKVTGMSCSSCVKVLIDYVGKLKQVSQINVALLTQKVELIAESQDLDIEEIVDCIEGLGYDAKLISSTPMNSISNKVIKFKIIESDLAESKESISANLQSIIGVRNVDINIPDRYVKVSVSPDFGKTDLDAGFYGPRDILDSLHASGLKCDLDNSKTHNAQTDELSSWRSLLLVSLIFGIPIFVLQVMDLYYAPAHWFLARTIPNVNYITINQALMILLNFPMQILVGYKYYRSAFYGALHGNFGMDCLVSIGTSTTFVFSIVQIIYAYITDIPAKHVFFEASGMLLMFVTLGKYFEAYAKGQTASSIHSLLTMQPKKALLAQPSNKNKISLSIDRFTSLNTEPTFSDENLREIDIKLVQRGDILKVLPGAQIPTDGYIVSGSTTVDESMITGESRPVSRNRNDFVFGSTINHNGLIYISAQSLGEDSAVSQIAQLVEQAQLTKAPVQVYADKLASMFTPMILIISGVVFITWSYLAYEHKIPRFWYTEEYGNPLLFAMLFAINVVVISCPCALGLATPTAIMVGTSVAASNGILIKGGPAFEEAKKINAIIFDKTGTLTIGKPVLTDDIILSSSNGKSSPSSSSSSSSSPSLSSTSSFPDHYIVMLAAVAEQGSEHPLAKAVLDAACKRAISIPKLSEDSFQNTPGSGISCQFTDGLIMVGNRGYMDQNGVVTGQRVDAAMLDLEIQGKTVVCVALNKELIGILGFIDKARPEAFSTLGSLFSLGIDIWMVTGDNRTTAHAIADELEIPRERVVAGVLPSEKLAKVEELQLAGFSVAMVGDGINDSPALAKANIGIAVGSGTQIAIDSADIVLIKNNLFDIIVALDLSRAVFNKIKLNFVWAMVYNIVAIPFAAGVWYPWTHMLVPPQYAGLSMALSSVSVVLSSLSLRFYRKPRNLIQDSSFIDIPIPDEYADTKSVSLLESAKRKISSIDEALKSRIKDGVNNSTANYSKLEMDDADENTLGLELGLGGFGRLKGSN